jgi:hypothetical protein
MLCSAGCSVSWRHPAVQAFAAKKPFYLEKVQPTNGFFGILLV